MEITAVLARYSTRPTKLIGLLDPFDGGRKMSVFVTVLAAFGSGVIAAALGGLPAVILCGLGVCIGMIGIVSGSDFNWLSNLAFGMFLGPHVAFAPACVAACYAKKKGYLENSMDIITPLASLNHYDTLIVGGIFGVCGWYLNVLIAHFFVGKIDTVAFTIVILCLAGRVIFGGDGIHGIIGRVPEGNSRFSPKNSNSWLPYMTEATGIKLILLGGGIGAVSSYITLLIMQAYTATGNEGLATIATMPLWGIAIVCCFVFVSGHNMPIFHHICIVSAMAAKMAYMGGGSADSCMVWGIAFGLFGAYAADFLARCFCVNGDGYVDPPTMAVAVNSVLLYWLFPATGISSPSSPFFWMIPIVLIVGLIFTGIRQQRIAESGMEPAAAIE